MLIDLSQDLVKTSRAIVQETLRETPLSEKLNDSFLSLDSLLDSLRGIVDSGQNDSVRLRAIETALKMHGSLSEKAAATPTIIITITNGPSVNPILFPRETINVNASSD